MRSLRELDSKAETEYRYVEVSILTLSRLDDFIATAVTSIRCGGTHKIEDHHQKLYHDTFASLFQKVFEKLVDTTRMLHNFGVLLSFHRPH